MGRLRAPEPLGDSHELDAFNCGEIILNGWLSQRARSNERNGASRTFVVSDGPRKVVGYYCLFTGAVAHVDAPGWVRRNMPEPVPIMVLGRTRGRLGVPG